MIIALLVIKYYYYWPREHFAQMKYDERSANKRTTKNIYYLRNYFENWLLPAEKVNCPQLTYAQHQKYLAYVSEKNFSWLSHD